MPHTNRKKKSKSSSRQQIVDDEGWTRIVTSTRNGNQDIQHRPFADHNATGVGEYHLHSAEDGSISPCLMTPAPFDTDMKIEDVEKKYRRVESKWLKSDACIHLQKLLHETVLQDHSRIPACVVLGTGTPTGYRRGWVGRHEVALFQIAIFKSVIDEIEKSQGTKPQCYAQEPNYNELDRQFLASLDIHMVDHPKAFHLITTNCLVYTPCAEVDVQMRTLTCDPALLLTSKLDPYEHVKAIQHATHHNSRSMEGSIEIPASQKIVSAPNPEVDSTETAMQSNGNILETFGRDKVVVRLPNLDAENYPFYNMHLYWRSPED